MPEPWRNRIVEHGEEAPDQLLANPRNWRIHPKYQQDALAGVLAEVGWVQDVIVNRTSGHVLDGHARVAIAISRGERTVPVVYVELNPDEEAKVLATFDPLGSLATTDQDAVAALLAEVSTEDRTVQRLLNDLSARAGAALTDLLDGEDREDGSDRDPGDVPLSDTRQVMLFYGGEDHAAFLRQVRALQQHYAIDNISDTVKEAIGYAHRALVEQAP